MNDDEAVRRGRYEADKDSDDWGEPEPARPRRRLAAMFSVRLSPNELEQIRRAADASGQSVSAFLRAAGLAAASRATRSTVPPIALPYHDLPSYVVSWSPAVTTAPPQYTGQAAVGHQTS